MPQVAERLAMGSFVVARSLRRSSPEATGSALWILRSAQNDKQRKRVGFTGTSKVDSPFRLRRSRGAGVRHTLNRTVTDTAALCLPGVSRLVVRPGAVAPAVCPDPNPQSP